MPLLLVELTSATIPAAETSGGQGVPRRVPTQGWTSGPEPRLAGGPRRACRSFSFRIRNMPN
eukprot:14424753-Alexandrium_andersonii.AAC.1